MKGWPRFIGTDGPILRPLGLAGPIIRAIALLDYLHTDLLYKLQFLYKRPIFVTRYQIIKYQIKSSIFHFVSSIELKTY